jgi:hypothetical protein
MRASVMMLVNSIKCYNTLMLDIMLKWDRAMMQVDTYMMVVMVMMAMMMTMMIMMMIMIYMMFMMTMMEGQSMQRCPS